MGSDQISGSRHQICERGQATPTLQSGRKKTMGIERGRCMRWLPEESAIARVTERVCDGVNRLAIGTALAASLGVPPAQAQLSITEGGTPNYSHPIAVPPGIGGLVPKVGLLYSGGGVNGPVGLGWSIQGISAITRCVSIKAIDGAPRAVDYSANDKLCLDGQRLIQTDANGAPSIFPQSNDSLGGTGMVREYRTEKDSFARIRAYGAAAGAAANGPAYFKVWTKAGQIYEYGTNVNTSAQAAITVQASTAVSVWAVSRISDTLGNYIDFQYEQRDVAWGSGPTAGSPTAGKEWNLQEIRYTGTPTQQPMNRVQFLYSDRPDTPGSAQDRSEAYHHGKKNVSVRLLDAVRTYTNWAGNTAPYPAAAPAGAIKVKTTKLSYEQGPITKRSRVKTLTECVGAAETQCLPPATFNYAAGGGDNYQANALFSASALATVTLYRQDGTYGVIPLDFNGDGKTDLLRWSTTPAENRLYKSVGDGTFTQVPNGTGNGQFNITDQQLFSAAGCFFSMVADFNGDGLPDILRYSASKNVDSDVPCPNQGSNYLYLSNGDGSFARSAVAGVALERHQSKKNPACLVTPGPGGCTDPGENGWSLGRNFYVLDADGDGKMDIVDSYLPPVSTALVPTDPCVGNTLCTRIFKGDGAGNFTQIPSNMGDKATFVQPNSGYTLGEPSVTADLNGDGLQDLARGGNPWLAIENAWRSRGDGYFDVNTSGSSCNPSIDFNGDGRADCLVVGGGPILSTLRVADGVGTTIVANFNLGGTLQALPGSGFQIGDVTGDGRQDIVYWADSSAAFLFVSNGDGRFTSAPGFSTFFSSAIRQLKKSDGTSDFVLGDFTGRGATEILRLKAAPSGTSEATTNQLYRKVDPTPPDQLLSVIGATGLTTTLTYLPLSNAAEPVLGARYTTDRSLPGATNPNAATYPKVDITAPMYVVTKSETGSGVGVTTVATEYSYVGLKADQTGRGLLGFREVRRQSPGPNGAALSTITRYHQDNPYIGSPARTETRLGTVNNLTAQLLSSADLTYCDKTAAAGAEALASATAPCPTSAKVTLPYLRRSVESGTDLSGTALPTITTTNTFSNSIDPTQIVVSTAGTVAGVSQTTTRTTTNAYFADNTAGDNWILGRLQTATQQNTVTNFLSQLSTTAGTAPYATATQGVAPAPAAGSITNIAFGTIGVGTFSTLVATVSSTGGAALSIGTPNAGSVSGTDFSFVSTTCASSLAVGATCTVSVKFQPTASVARSGTLSVVTGAGTLSSALSGTGSASSVSVTTNNATALSAPQGRTTSATGTVVFTNSGNQAVTLTMSGLVSPYDVSPTTCSAAAGGGTCTVTVSMATGGPIGSQGTQTLIASGASSGNVAASVSGTVTGSIATLTSAPPSFGVVWYGAATPSAGVSFRNDGNSSLTLNGLIGLSSLFQVSANNCTGIAPGSSCSMTVSMPTTAAGSGPNSVSTDGARVNATFSIDGAVYSAVSRWAATTLAFGNVGVGSSSTQNINIFNDGYGASINWSTALSNVPAGFSANTSACASVVPGGSCNVSITFSPTAVQAYGGGSIYPPNISYGGNLLTVTGTGVAAVPAVSGNPTTLSFGVVPKGNDADLTMTLTNTGTGAATSLGFGIAYTSGTTAVGMYQQVGGTCSPGASIAPNASCTVVMRYLATCGTSSGSRNGTLTTSGSNFAAVVTTLTAGTGTGVCN
jgi:hypothetical protein